MVLVPRTSKSAKNRYLYHDGRLNRLPSSLITALMATLHIPMIRKALPGIFREPWVRQMSLGNKDESVHAFLSRRFGSPVADTFASAMIHGIYAGDSRELSVQSILPFLVDLEEIHGSVLRSLMPFGHKLNARYQTGKRDRVSEEKERFAQVTQRLPPSLVETMKNTSIYSFPNGLGEIIDALADHLMSRPNVEIRMASPCEKVQPNSDGFVLSVQNESVELQAHRIVAALPAAKLAHLLPDLPHLNFNPSATLSVVDVVLAPPDGSAMRYTLPIEGFGFLVPRNTANNNDEILGVVLDSDAVPNQSPEGKNGCSYFTKITIMLGGPYWRGVKKSELPSKSEVEQRALRALRGMLGIPKDILNSHLRYLHGRILFDTIPQYLVGHITRLQEIHSLLMHNAQWRDRLTLLGYSYSGVGINDCVTNALDACDAIIQQESGFLSYATASQSTGLSTMI